ncbi:polycystic kidney disease protein 1-like 3 [Coregonus clupeaformis]|uniref:polycystic kidney disease protein 1-like 3 n=1 Tax=Coregonus clupeaformis TaxID=59861 RepID=UPI001BE0576C|nr:polycystic kidney disease protein 1-like 3 [Coregonus clupeaformis]
MPTSRLAFDPIIMDAREQANPNLHFGVNGGHDGTKRNSRSRPCEDKALQFLSQEEQDCILFFEETIDSLLTTPAVAELDGPRPPILASTPSPSPSPVPPLSALDRPTSPKDQDIIDLVHPAQPDLVQPIQAPFNPPMPDFTQNMVMNNPERHFENKPRREAMENFPTEYNLPLPGKDSAPYGHALYQPVGSVPTPVLIAQKIAEHQGSGGNTNILSSSLLSNRHRSLDLENIKRPPTSPDYPIKQGPNTSAKPTHYPGNISMIMGSNHHHSHSLASVNLQDRKSQMLANLSGTSHPVEAEELHELQKVRVNLPTRSESFRDPTPNKSRMEALSKLGLTRNRSPSGDLSLLITPNSSTNTKPAAAPIPVATPTPVPTPTPTLTPVSKPDVARQANPLPPATVNTSFHASIHDNKPASPPPEVSSKDFNSYGGKTIVVNPSKAAAAAPSTGGHGNKAHPVTSHSDFNPYGGKTKVMTPAPVTTTRADPPQPDIQSRAMPPPASTSTPARVMPPTVSTSTPARVMPPTASTSTPARVMPPPASTSTPARVMPPPASTSTPARVMPPTASTSTPARVMPPPASTSNLARVMPPPVSTSYPARVMPPPVSTSSPARVMPPPVSTSSPARVMPPPASTSNPARVMPPPAFNSTPAKRMPPPASTSIPTKVETMPYEVNSYREKTRMVTPSHTTPSPITTPDILAYTLVRSPSKASAPVLSPAPRPFRYSTPPSSNGVVASPPSTQSRRKSISKPSFRPQGITVQFSGRGVTDESRREALRKLGLLKDTF